MKTPNGTTKKKKRSAKDRSAADGDAFHDPNLDMSTSPEAPRSSVKRKRKSNGTGPSTESSKKSKGKKTQTLKAAKASSKKVSAFEEPSPPPRLGKNKACIRCREKKIKCNEAKPTCNQCQRGLWTCQYEGMAPKPQRSRNGCLNCKQRRRKCTEEKPACAYCLKVDDDCNYAEYY